MTPTTDQFRLSLNEMLDLDVEADASITLFLRERLGVEFGQWCGRTGKQLSDGGNPKLLDIAARGQLAQVVASSGTAEVIAEDGNVFTLAIPFLNSEGDSIVAIREFLASPLSQNEINQLANRCDASPEKVKTWAASEAAWSPSVLTQLAETSRQLQMSLQEAAKYRAEAEQASISLSRTYEEISLLYAITQNLRLSNSEKELGELALGWLHDCLSAEAVVMVYLPSEDSSRKKKRDAAHICAHGDTDVTVDQILALVEYLDLSELSGPQIAQSSTCSEAEWPVPGVRQLVIAPKLGDGRLFGWVAAINQTDDDEFDSTDASLLNTVCSILGTHSGNHDLYRRQASFLAAVVGSLTSAIDAKDPYTSGHSNRVAQIAVRLGQELGCTEDQLNTLYLGGLLHDIGKIGIDDNVLRKPGRLTDEEFAHIKEHPELGYRILEDIRELKDVLPIVLHHHEQWNGGGYPHKLVGEETPWLARITAVSDSYDAMTSDRTYRKGMPVERVEAIFREGAGDQWDAEVIDAYFACSDDIRAIAIQEGDDGFEFNAEAFAETL